jgi:hypothetical protein
LKFENLKAILFVNFQGNVHDYNAEVYKNE